MFPKYEFRSASINIMSFSSFKGCSARFHNHIEMGFVTKGTLRVNIENKSYILNEGDLYVAFPNIIHSVNENDADFIVVIADSALFPTFYESLSKSYPPYPIVRKESLPESVFCVAKRLLELSNRKTVSNHESLATNYVNAILGEIFITLECVKRNADTSLIQKLMLYLLNNYTDDITLESVAKTLGYSKWYVSKVISSTFGFNFRTLVNSYRIGLAENLLLTSQKSIASIAFECGFKNQSSFNRVFVESTEMTPSEFRQRGGTPLKKPEIVYT